MRSSISLCLALATLVAYTNALDCAAGTINVIGGGYTVVAGMPNTYDNGLVVGDEFATINCVAGYTTGTAGTIQCLTATGAFDVAWTITPVCNAITDYCPLPTDAGYDFTSCTLTGMNDTCTPTCLNGYATGTIGQLTCTGTGTTSGSGSFGTPTGCTLDPSYCAAPSATTGFNYTGCTNTSWTAWCAPTCALGYTGTAEMIECTGSAKPGSWNNSAITGCALNTAFCPALTTKGYDFTGCARSMDAECTPVCAEGYTGTPKLIKCGTDGQWNNTFNECTPTANYCPAPSATGYSFTGCGRTVEDSCTPTCINGYTGTPKLIACEPTTFWNNTFNECTLDSAYCSAPTTQTGYNFAPCSNNSWSAWCQPTCATGYTGTASMIQCSGTSKPGAWNSSTITGCALDTAFCPALTTTGYSFTGCLRRMNDECVPTCVPGYDGTPKRIKCQSSATWNNTFNECTANAAWCPAPVQTGYVFTCPTDKSYNTQCTVKCAADYTGTPAAVTCQAGKTYETAVGCTPSKTGAASSITSPS